MRDLEPWPKPVSGRELLNDLYDTFRDFVSLSEHYADALALWTMHAHCFDCFLITPRLRITSPVPECGKTVLIRLMAQLTPRAIRVDNLTAAVMFRLIERDRPTLLIDEADTFLPGNKELRGVIDSGHASDGHFPRCAGKGHEPVAFNTFGPVALAGLGDVHPTVASRSITIELQRKLPSEKIDELMVDDFPFLEKLNRKALRWANDHADDLTRARPKMPPALANRARDNWWPLLAIADVAGGHWPETARKAALRLTAHNQGDQDVRVLLLRDLRVIFSEADGDKLTTRHILQALAKLDDGPWAEFRSGRAITAGQLSELLRPFHIAPSTIRMSTTTAKGYRREQFQDAWRRYLPAAD